jgi:hypothetical protein
MTSFESDIGTPTRFGSAAAINDPKQSEAPNGDEVFQSVDGLCDGPAAELRDDRGLRAFQYRVPSFTEVEDKQRNDACAPSNARLMPATDP